MIESIFSLKVTAAITAIMLSALGLLCLLAAGMIISLILEGAFG